MALGRRPMSIAVSKSSVTTREGSQRPPTPRTHAEGGREPIVPDRPCHRVIDVASLRAPPGAGAEILALNAAIKHPLCTARRPASSWQHNGCALALR